MKNILEFADRIPLLDKEFDILAEDYFQHLHTKLPSNTKFIVIIRNSSTSSKPALPNQKAYTQLRLNQLGYRIHYVVSYNGSGHGDKWLRWLEQEVIKARELQIPMLFLSVCRAIRNPEIERNYKLPPRLADFETIKEIFKDEKPYTIIHPGFSVSETRKILGEIGKELKGNYGGRKKKRLLNNLTNRPRNYQKKIREEFLPLALNLRSQGISLRKIAKEVSSRSEMNFSHPAIIKWFKFFENKKKVVD